MNKLNNRPARSASVVADKPQSVAVTSPHTFGDWLRAAPPVDDAELIPATITVSLSVDRWLAISEAACRNQKTVDEVVSYALKENVEVLEWSNYGYDMD